MYRIPNVVYYDKFLAVEITDFKNFYTAYYYLASLLKISQSYILNMYVIYDKYA